MVTRKHQISGEVHGPEQRISLLDGLRTFTLNGAYLTFDDDIRGSLEVGKLGDVLVLNENPLDDIRHTTDILYVMKDGVLYDAETLDEIWPDPKPYGAYPWLLDGIYDSDDHPVRE